MQYFYAEKDYKKSIQNGLREKNEPLNNAISSKNRPQNVADRQMLEKMKDEEARLRAQIAFGWNGYFGWY